MLRVLWSLIVCMCVTSALAQTGSIKGLVVDVLSHSPLQNVTVQATANKNSLSDDLGRFAIYNIVPGQYELIVSHIGYKTEFIPVEVSRNNIANVSVQLKKAEISLSDIILSAKKSVPLNTIAALDIKLRPINTAQDVLRIVPGLFIAQHAGGGKAEQIFMRGYDIDHGTDIHIAVDGVPVNMVSHAHGQGYSDLHYVIPETIENVHFNYGPYAVQKGNFATAGYVELQTKDRLAETSIKLEGGQFNTKRAVGLFPILHKEKEKNNQQLFLATEYFTSNGYFKNPQDFHRFNVMAKYNAWWNHSNQFTLIASNFNSKWNASGQVPERAITTGLIDRFGSLDSTEGGNTHRTGLTAKWVKQWKNDWKTTQQIFLTKYQFSLFSNFTFYLKDSINGDQINQKENRTVFGYAGTLSKDWMLQQHTMKSELGYGLRYDDIKNSELDHTVQRRFLHYIQKGIIHEQNAYAYAQQSIDLTHKLHANMGLRYDYFTFGYQPFFPQSGAKMVSKSKLNPKLNLGYEWSKKVNLFVSAGTGFHTNDVRVILENKTNKIIPGVVGIDVGFMIKPAKNSLFKIALWQLLSQQEFVYVGDEGIVEAGGASKRMGIDFSARQQINKWLFADVDLNASHGRSTQMPKGENFIPLAPSFTSTGGLTAKSKNGFNASLRYRLLKDRPANETNTVIARGYFIIDAVVRYRWRHVELFSSVENLLNSAWKEAQFDTESRLKNEGHPIAEIHFTPGTPRFFKAGITLQW